MRSLALALVLVAGCAESHGRAPDAGGERCGPVTCGEGTYCCNASCGAECAEPGGVPVCGCDRRDYLDACSAQVAGVDVMHLGPCDGSAPIALRSARMFGECGIAGGVLTHIELADDVRSCSGELGRSVRVTLFENLDLSRAPRTFSLGGTSVEGRADACTDGAAGTSCVTASGTITIHAYASGEIARLEYDVRAADGARYAASDLALTGLFCPFVHPGCR